MGLRRRGDDEAPRVVGFDFDRLAAGAPPAPAAPPPAWTDDNPFAEPETAPVGAPVAAAVAFVPAYAAPFSTPVPPPRPGYEAPAPPPGYLPPASHWQQPGPPVWDLPATERRGTRMSFLVALGVVVALVVGGGVAYTVYEKATGGVTAPATLNGQPRLEDGPIVDEITKGVPDFERLGDKVAVGVYGDTITQSYVLVAAEGEVGVGGMHAGFSKQGRAQGVTVSRLVRVGDLSCANVTALGARFGACFWSGRRSSGYVFDITGDPIAETARVTRLARTAVEK